MKIKLKASLDCILSESKTNGTTIALATSDTNTKGLSIKGPVKDLLRKELVRCLDSYNRYA